MSKQSLPSIEEFAAYLDGNLPLSERQRLSKLAEQNDAFQQLLEANSVIDDTIAGFNYTDLQLPPEIDEVHFEMPIIKGDDIAELVTLTPEPIDYITNIAPPIIDDDFPQSPICDNCQQHNKMSEYNSDVLSIDSTTINPEDL